jgi:Tfp pilus assembly protein PilF
MKMKKNDYAISLIDNYLQKFSNEEKKLKSVILSIKADEMMEHKEYEKAFDCYEKSLQFDVHNTGTLNNYAYFLAECGLELSKAENMSGKTIQAEPQNATYLDTYAWILFKQNDFRSAKFYIERALIYDKSETLLEHYGDILFALGDAENAVIQWIKSQEAGNKSEILKKKIDEKNYFPNENKCM